MEQFLKDQPGREDPFAAPKCVSKCVHLSNVARFITTQEQ